ncbi:MAG: alpha/beta hydrolase [Eubacteriales bacterium]|nr:alpha/beta hydrolase [Eubacteriales bacterium]
MIHDIIHVSETSNAVIEAYILSPEEYARKGMRHPAVLICPGGGYSLIARDEGEPIAHFFNRHGYHAFVLTYSVGIENPFPTALQEAARAISIIRSKAAEWLINDVYACGFSAGGNLALSLGIFCEDPVITSDIGLTTNQVRPDKLILGYPVVTFSPTGMDDIVPDDIMEKMANGQLPDFRNANIFESLLGHKNVTEAEKRSLNVLPKVHKHMPPTFIWGGFEDILVPASDLTDLAKRLYELSIPCELHVFGHGSHGTSLADLSVKDSTEVQNISMGEWTKLCIQWLRQ